MHPLRFATCVLAWAVSACSGRHETPAESAPVEMIVRHGESIAVPAASPLRARLTVRTITLEELRHSFEAPAQIAADPSHMVRVTPPVPGRVVDLKVHLGDTVARNSPLLTLDSADMVAVQTEYLEARSQLAQSDRTLARQSDLVDHGIGAQRDLEVAQTEQQIARQEVERSLERLRLYGLSAGAIGRPMTLRSPIAGRVVELHVAPGEYHADPTDVLMTIADLQTVWVTASIQEKDIRRVTQDAQADVTLTAYPGEHWTGNVSFVGEILDPDTRTLEVRVPLGNADRRLRPGMFASVRFAETVEQVLRVPSTAVILIGDANFVFVETRPWEFARRRVELGDSVGDTSIVTSGLRSGERVVVTNAVLLQ